MSALRFGCSTGIFGVAARQHFLYFSRDRQRPYLSGSSRVNLRSMRSLAAGADFVVEHVYFVESLSHHKLSRV